MYLYILAKFFKFLIVPQLSCAVFEDIGRRTELSLKLTASEKSGEIELQLQALEQEGQRIRSRLKPSLG